MPRLPATQPVSDNPAAVRREALGQKILDSARERALVNRYTELLAEDAYAEIGRGVEPESVTATTPSSPAGHEELDPIISAVVRGSLVTAAG